MKDLLLRLLPNILVFILLIYIYIKSKKKKDMANIKYYMLGIVLSVISILIELYYYLYY